MNMNYQSEVLKLLVKKQSEQGWSETEIAEWAGTTSQGWFNWKARGGVPNDKLLPLMEKLGIQVNKLLKLVVETGVYPHTPSQGNVEDGPPVRGKVPLISSVAAGVWTPTADPFLPGDADEWFECPVPHSNKTYVLRVKGDSMDAGNGEGYRNGELIFVDPLVEPMPGDDVIVRLADRDDTTFKRLQSEDGKLYLVPLNPNWPERIIPVDEKAYFKGVVIFSGKIRRR
jgi:SOS-response transcriptional repressor LexA